MRAPWSDTPAAMAGTWRYSLVRVDFPSICARDGPFIYTFHTNFHNTKIDEIVLGIADTTQTRRLSIKIVQKAITLAHKRVFGKKPDLNERMSHVSLLKIPPKFILMIENVFRWYGYEGFSPVYSLPFQVEDVTGRMAIPPHFFFNENCFSTF